MKRFKISQLDCVKRKGFGHYIAHKLGIANFSVCMHETQGYWISEGLIKGFKESVTFKQDHFNKKNTSEWDK